MQLGRSPQANRRAEALAGAALLPVDLGSAPHTDVVPRIMNGLICKSYHSSIPFAPSLAIVGPLLLSGPLSFSERALLSRWRELYSRGTGNLFAPAACLASYKLALALPLAFEDIGIVRYSNYCCFCAAQFKPFCLGARTSGAARNSSVCVARLRPRCTRRAFVDSAGSCASVLMSCGAGSARR